SPGICGPKGLTFENWNHRRLTRTREGCLQEADVENDAKVPREFHWGFRGLTLSRAMSDWHRRTPCTSQRAQPADGNIPFDVDVARHACRNLVQTGSHVDYYEN